MGARNVDLPRPPLLVISDRSQARRPLIEIAEEGREPRDGVPGYSVLVARRGA